MVIRRMVTVPAHRCLNKMSFLVIWLKMWKTEDHFHEIYLHPYFFFVNGSDVTVRNVQNICTCVIFVHFLSKSSLNISCLVSFSKQKIQTQKHMFLIVTRRFVTLLDRRRWNKTSLTEKWRKNGIFMNSNVFSLKGKQPQESTNCDAWAILHT